MSPRPRSGWGAADGRAETGAVGGQAGGRRLHRLGLGHSAAQVADAPLQHVGGAFGGPRLGVQHGGQGGLARRQPLDLGAAIALGAFGRQQPFDDRTARRRIRMISA